LLAGFVVFLPKMNAFGEAGLCSFVMVCAGSVPVVFPVFMAFPILLPEVVPGGTLIILPGGSVPVLLFPGWCLSVGSNNLTPYMSLTVVGGAPARSLTICRQTVDVHPNSGCKLPFHGQLVSFLPTIVTIK